ncbi:uncharacterized protein RHO25_002888 [Cercospora beticola]|uniref:F-box domain-containing protein n=1 Tax=Cercospora beticola TaxID=122368 RepID=A0ABZ0NFF6_CERBT|nr:hypothetical protein RHO25_002888 [Cercospora beticola]
MNDILGAEDVPPIFHLPDELLELIIEYLPPTATLAFGTTSRRSNKIVYEPLVWRRHCVQTWKYWQPEREFGDKLHSPPAQTKWRMLYNERARIDREATDLFNEALLTQQNRYARMEEIANYGYDVKDLMLRLRDETPDDAEDVLARRFHADALLGQIHRATALEKWMRLQRRQMVRLEEVLGAYDLFVLSGHNGDLNDIDKELDRLADQVRHQNGEDEFDELSVRRKAVLVAEYLRSQGLLANAGHENYHALRNNFLSMALFEENYTCLPLQAVAIYCAVARRLGINAKPSNYPQHVHAVIEAPSGMTLDGKHIMVIAGAEPELMHMDPWRSHEEVPLDQLRLRLLQMGAPDHQHTHHLSATTSLEMCLRTGRNIMASVQEARERHRAIDDMSGPDIEAAWYSMLWSMIILGDNNSASTLHRRRQCLPYLVEHFQAHFPEDISLIEKYLPTMFAGEREHSILLHLINERRTDDRNKKAPTFRTAEAANVTYCIGTHFRHKRYSYEGVVVGWDRRCSAEQRWIEQMRVDDLPRGREQPFYNIVYDQDPTRARLLPASMARHYYMVLCVARGADDAASSRADDKSVRYVAEENIEVVDEPDERPSEVLMALAGRYFKRWDQKERIFVSNIKDEYPDD